ncbi:MAG: hypothetical protein H0U59_11415 [Gemmatimonadaceae bacterium]|nr:hypothetical protein [Gemmatimonadaceae bacterium]
MPTPFAGNDIYTQQMVRLFTQSGGAGAGNALKFAGIDQTWVYVGEATIPDNGGIEAINVFDPTRAKAFQSVGFMESAPGYPTFGLTLMDKRKAVAKLLQASRCPYNFYMVLGYCKDLSDAHNGWDRIRIYANNRRTQRTLPGGAWTDDNGMEHAQEWTSIGGIYDYLPVSVGSIGATAIALEVIDTTYNTNFDCGDCGPATSGTDQIYAVVKSTAVSPAASPKVAYTLDGGATVTSLAITGIGATEDPYAIRVIGQYLVVFTDTAGGATTGGYYYSLMSANGTPSSTWTKVTTGFVATFTPNDVFVLSARDVFIVADNGYIYYTDDITSGVEVRDAANATGDSLTRVRGRGTTLVAFGATGTVLKSVNRGDTWASVITEPTTDNLTAGEVIDEFRYWAGDDTGKTWYTVDGGEVWTQLAFTSAANIRDILFVTPEVGYVAYSTATPAGRLMTTFDGGQTWSNAVTANSRILNLPVHNRINRLAAPRTGMNDIDANTFAAAGLSAGATDGIWYVGSPSTIG